MEASVDKMSTDIVASVLDCFFVMVHFEFKSFNYMDLLPLQNKEYVKEQKFDDDPNSVETTCLLNHALAACWQQRLE